MWADDAYIRDVVRSAETKYQSSRSILHGLYATDKVGRQADQRSVTVVQPAEKQSSNKRLKDGRRDEVTNAEQVTRRLAHVSAHHQVRVDEDAQVAYRGHRGDGR